MTKTNTNNAININTDIAISSSHDMAVLALSKAKFAGVRPVAGTYEIDERVRIKGTLTVAKDQEIKSTSKLLSVDNMILLLHYAGVTRSSALDAISKVLDDDSIDMSTVDVDGSIRKALNSKVDTGKTTKRSGAVKFKGEIL